MKAFFKYLSLGFVGLVLVVFLLGASAPHPITCTLISLAHVYHIGCFDAVAGDATDDTAEIQDAIDTAAAAAFGIVYCPADGQYDLSQAGTFANGIPHALRIPDDTQNFWFIGGGWGCILQKDAIGYVGLGGRQDSHTTAFDNILFANFSIVGVGSQANATTANDKGIYIQASGSPFTERVAAFRVKATNNDHEQIYLEGRSSWMIANYSADGAHNCFNPVGRHGDTAHRASVVLGNVCVDGGANGIEMGALDHAIVLANSWENIDTRCVRLSANNLQYAIVGNTCSGWDGNTGTSTAGILIGWPSGVGENEGASRGVVIGNSIRNHLRGVLLQNSSTSDSHFEHIVALNMIETVDREGVFVRSDDGGMRDIFIVANMIVDAGQETTNTFDAIRLQTFGSAIGVDKITFPLILLNDIRSRVVTQVKHGIRIGSSDVEDAWVALNDMRSAFGTAGISDAGTRTLIGLNKGHVTENQVLSGTFAIDSTGVKTVTIAHGLDVTPALQDVQLLVVEETDVDDWGYDLLKVESVDATNVVAKINVSSASATGSATARLALRVQ